MALATIDREETDAGAESALAAADAANLAGEFSRALGLVAELGQPTSPRARLGMLLVTSWARMHLGDLAEADGALQHARALAEAPEFDDVNRAEVLFQLGCVRLMQNAVSNAASLLTLALELADRSGSRCDRLRALILERRARCCQRQRDWDAARADLERALELADELGDPRTRANVYFAASVVAERERQWLLARFYAEQARDLYHGLGDSAAGAKVLNNLGGLAFLLGDGEAAHRFLADAFALAAEVGDDIAAGYALSSLAQVHLRSGEPHIAEQRARRALDLLRGRSEHAAEIGSAELVLGRALAALGRCGAAETLLLQAEVTLSALSPSHQAAAWMAQGELNAAQGRHEAAVEQYRRAAEALQDIHF